MSTKEINERLSEINARRGDIRTEIETADEARMTELEAEVDNLDTEARQLRARLDLSTRLGAPIEQPDGRGKSDSVEQRAKALRETRSVTISGGTLVQPKMTGEISPMMNQVSSVVDLVKSVPCTGMGAYQVPYEKTLPEAEKTAEGAAVGDSEPTYGYADITPVTVSTYCEVSREVLKLTNQDYLSRVEAAAKNALRKKAASYIMNSDAAEKAKFVGIFSAPACVTDITVGVIDAGTLRKIAMNYGGDENIAGNAVLLLNKKDLVRFGDVRGTNEKKAVYEITPDTANPNTGMIKDGGLSVRYVLNSAVKDLESATAGDYCMAYGVPECYEMGVFSDYTIIVDESVALKRRMIAILGEVMLGGNVTVYDGFIRVKKAGA